MPPALPNLLECPLIRSFSSTPAHDAMPPCKTAAPGRDAVESWIKEAYARAYDAVIDVDYPVLISLQDARGEVTAAAGYRRADSGALFLEQYTREPVEKIMSRLSGQAIPRGQIAEIGNFVSASGGASLYLYMTLAMCLQHAGITHVMVTVTEDLHRRFMRLGLHCYLICEAAPDLLVGPLDEWGRYYETQPRVLGGSLDDAIARLGTLPAMIRYSGRPLRVCVHDESGHE